MRAPFVFHEDDSEYMAKVAAADVDWQNLWNKYITPSHDSVRILTGAERRDRLTVGELLADVEKFNKEYRPNFKEETVDNPTVPVGTPTRSDVFSVVVRSQQLNDFIGAEEPDRLVGAILRKIDYLGVGSEIVVRWRGE